MESALGACDTETPGTFHRDYVLSSSPCEIWQPKVLIKVLAHDFKRKLGFESRILNTSKILIRMISLYMLLDVPHARTVDEEVLVPLSIFLQLLQQLTCVRWRGSSEW